MKKDETQWIIYALYDESDPLEYRYIGVTARRIKDRLKWHIKAAKRGDGKYDQSYRAKWIRKVLRAGRQIRIVSLFTSENSKDDIAKIEQKTVDKYISIGHNLTNTANCSRSFWKGCHHSKESKEKIRNARMGIKVPEEIAEKTRGGKNGWATPIYQYSKDGEFIKRYDCINDAYKEFGKNVLTCRNISACAIKNEKKLYQHGNKRYYSSMGFVWHYNKIIS